MLIATIPQLRLLDPHPSKAMPTAAFPSYPLYTDSRMIFGHHHARATPPSPEGKVEGSQPCTQGAQGSSQWEPATPDSSASLIAGTQMLSGSTPNLNLQGAHSRPHLPLKAPSVCVHSATYLKRQDVAQGHCAHVPPTPVLRPCSPVLPLDACHCHPSLLSEGPQRTAIASASSSQPQNSLSACH